MKELIQMIISFPFRVLILLLFILIALIEIPIYVVFWSFNADLKDVMKPHEYLFVGYNLAFHGGKDQHAQ